MNERIKELRKTLGLTLEKFGERVGVTKVTISRIENNVNSVTEQMFKSICREFNVSEEWLRDGVGEMFIIPEDELNSEQLRQRIIGALSIMSESDIKNVWIYIQEHHKEEE